MDDAHLDTVPDMLIPTLPSIDAWAERTRPDLTLPHDWDVPTLVTHRAPRRHRLGTGPTAR